MNILNDRKVSGMFHNFKFSNYRSFVNETIFDMTATNIREHNDSVLHYKDNAVGILPVSAIYGANASGKSTFFKALKAMQNIVIGIDTDSEIEKILTTPFYFSEEKYSEPSSFEITFSLNEENDNKLEYIYGFKCDRKKILSEYLYKKRLSPKDTVLKAIYDINENGELESVTNSKKQKEEIEYCFSHRSNRKLMLTEIAGRKKDTEILKAFEYIKSLGVFEDFNDAFSDQKFVKKTIGLFYKDIIESSTKYDEKIFLDMVKWADPAIEGLKIISLASPNDTQNYDINTIHIKDGKEVEFPFNEESTGTKKFIFLLLFLYVTLKNGNPLFIDELDCQLHPLLLRKVIKMFTSKETNKNNAQLIFSAHNIINLDNYDLRRDEIWFVEKNNQMSEMYSLYDFKDDGVRSDLSYGKYYLSGRFGAVPFQNEKDDKSLEEFVKEYDKENET